MSCKNAFQLVTVLAVLLIVCLPASKAVAICPVSVDSFGYYEGCGSAPTFVGDSWKECFGYSGGWGTTGNWRERLRMYCGINEVGWCYDATPVTTYWTKCGDQWLERTQSQMANGDCNCP